MFFKSCRIGDRSEFILDRSLWSWRRHVLQTLYQLTFFILWLVIFPTFYILLSFFHLYVFCFAFFLHLFY